MSEQEWRDAINEALNDIEDDGEDVEYPDQVRVIFAAIAPLRERERQQAQQEALAPIVAFADELRAYPQEGAGTVARAFADEMIRRFTAAGGAA